MHSNVLARIEKMSNTLSRQEILWLVDQFIHRLRENDMFNELTNLGDHLISMSEDPEIQVELRKINNEFEMTESDGFGTM